MGSESEIIYWLKDIYARTALRDKVAIDGLAVSKWQNDYTCSGALEIVADPDVYHNLEAGVPHYVTSVDMEVLTASKECYFELGYTDAQDATGNFTGITPRWFLDRGVASQSGTFVFRPWSIPHTVVYEEDVTECITYRIEGTDALTHVMMAWKGWEEQA